jgi:hypothetical protein
MRIFKFKKPKFLLGLPIALFSLEAYLGLLSGYFLSKYLSAKEAGQKNRWWKSLVFRIGNWQIHLHHWLYGVSIILVSTAFFNFSLPFPQFSYAFLGGAIFQGIYCYQDWYKILIRKKES